MIGGQFILNILDKIKTGIAKPYITPVIIGFALLYYKGEAEALNSFAVGTGYCFIIGGFLIFVITSVMNIRIELYERIIVKYENLLKTSTDTIQKREDYIHTRDGITSSSTGKDTSNVDGQKKTPDISTPI